MSEEKNKGQILQEELGYDPKNAWLKIDENEKKTVFEFSEKYKKFLDSCKTERETIDWAEQMARNKGFISLDSVINNKGKLSPGDKVYKINRGKSMVLAVMGQTPLEHGLNILGAHVDAPRIDLKPNPLYEDSELALFKTHYYGGIKKYQWTTIPLALHGVIFKSDGEKVKVSIGEDESDPQFCIPELLIHLSQEQMQKKMSEGVTGEGLNLLVGSMPYNEEKLKDKIKTHILETLKEKYGIKEEDFQRAELEIVPAFKARDIGFDRSMVGSYGQDDRVCTYASLEAIFNIDSPSRTALCLLTDKEEIGSVGATGAQSRFFENTVAELCALTAENYSDIIVRRSLTNSKFLSADVTGVVDPTYSDVNDKRNATFMGKGVAIMKYTGSRGKYDASEASAEFMSEITNLLNNNNVIWQSGELGKVDLGGGGTIAQYFANYGMDVVDIGTGLLSMHSPYEITSKVDIYMTYKAYEVFYREVK